jgi:hypothetical protein
MRASSLALLLQVALVQAANASQSDREDQLNSISPEQLDNFEGDALKKSKFDSQSWPVLSHLPVASIFINRENDGQNPTENSWTRSLSFPLSPVTEGFQDGPIVSFGTPASPLVPLPPRVTFAASPGRAVPPGPVPVRARIPKVRKKSEQVDPLTIQLLFSKIHLDVPYALTYSDVPTEDDSPEDDSAEDCYSSRGSRSDRCTSRILLPSAADPEEEWRPYSTTQERRTVRGARRTPGDAAHPIRWQPSLSELPRAYFTDLPTRDLQIAYPGGLVRSYRPGKSSHTMETRPVLLPAIEVSPGEERFMCQITSCEVNEEPQQEMLTVSDDSALPKHPTIYYPTFPTDQTQ